MLQASCMLRLTATASAAEALRTYQKIMRGIAKACCLHRDERDAGPVIAHPLWVQVAFPPKCKGSAEERAAVRVHGRGPKVLVRLRT